MKIGHAVSPARRKRKVYAGNGLSRSQQNTAILFLAPAMILIFIFLLYPFVLSIVYSFTNKMLVSRPGTIVKLVGFANYKRLSKDNVTVISFLNTLKYVVMAVPTIMILGTLLALLVNRRLKGVRFFRVLYFSPQVVTMTVVAVVWSFILSSRDAGLMNSFLGLFGIGTHKWLQDPKFALFSIAIMSIWQVVGLEMIIILGGLQYIPEGLYEASELDGCNSVQRFFYVTLPMLKNTMVYVLVSVTIDAFRLYTPIYVLTKGGPSNSTATVVYQIYQAGFVDKQQGFSSAISVIFFIIVLIISLLQNYLMRDK